MKTKYPRHPAKVLLDLLRTHPPEEDVDDVASMSPEQVRSELVNLGVSHNTPENLKAIIFGGANDDADGDPRTACERQPGEALQRVVSSLNEIGINVANVPPLKVVEPPEAGDIRAAHDGPKPAREPGIVLAQLNRVRVPKKKSVLRWAAVAVTAAAACVVCVVGGAAFVRSQFISVQSSLLAERQRNDAILLTERQRYDALVQAGISKIESLNEELRDLNAALARFQESDREAATETKRQFSELRQSFKTLADARSEATKTLYEPFGWKHFSVVDTSSNPVGPSNVGYDWGGFYSSYSGYHLSGVGSVISRVGAVAAQPSDQFQLGAGYNWQLSRKPIFTYGELYLKAQDGVQYQLTGGLSPDLYLRDAQSPTGLRVFSSPTYSFVNLPVISKY